MDFNTLFYPLSLGKGENPAHGFKRRSGAGFAASGRGQQAGPGAMTVPIGTSVYTIGRINIVKARQP
jgi:hypothetical protein